MIRVLFADDHVHIKVDMSALVCEQDGIELPTYFRS